MAYSYCKSNSIACNAINISFVAFKVACFDAKNNQFVCYYFARSLPRSIFFWFFFVSFTICAMWAHFIALLSLLWPGTHTHALTLTHTHAHTHNWRIETFWYSAAAGKTHTNWRIETFWYSAAAGKMDRLKHWHTELANICA